MPGLWLRVAADLPGILVDDVEPVDAARETLVDALRSSGLGDVLEQVVAPVDVKETTTASSGTAWGETAGVHQSTALASYQLGGDATTGWAAIVTLAFPGHGQGGSVGVVVDVALTLDGPVPPAGFVCALATAATLAAVTDPTVAAPLLPPHAGVMSMSLHVVASDPSDSVPSVEPSSVELRVDLTAFGPVSRGSGGRPACGCSLASPRPPRR